MTRLSEAEKRELLADATSASRRAEFVRLDARLVHLTPYEYLNFLNWSSNWFSTPKMAPMTGDSFLL